MKKYLYIYKSTLIENLSYIPNIMLGFITFFITMFVLINLWQYIYSDPNEVINGYTIEQMMWYVLITETLWYGTKNKILTNEISQDIRTGNIAYNIYGLCCDCIHDSRCTDDRFFGGTKGVVINGG